jgi:HAD superfamily hydrolase (TIGR01490 family)
MKKALALFDFDGTLTRKDTLFAFINFFHGRPRMLLGMIVLLPWLVGLRLRLFSAHSVKVRTLKMFLGNLSSREFNRQCEVFCSQVLPGIVRASALERIAFHKGRGDRMVIVSASPENWIRPWASLYDIEVIGTRLVISGERVTGEIEGLNCNGAQKSIRVKEHIDLSQYAEIYAYGDTSGDRELLALATHPFYRQLK